MTQTALLMGSVSVHWYQVTTLTTRRSMVTASSRRRQMFWMQPEQNENVRSLQKLFCKWTVSQAFNTAPPHQPPPPPPPPKAGALKQLFPKIGSPSSFSPPLLSSVWNQKYVNTERPSLSERYCSPLLWFFTACLCCFSRGAEADGFSKQACLARAAKKKRKENTEISQVLRNICINTLWRHFSPQLHSYISAALTGFIWAHDLLLPREDPHKKARQAAAISPTKICQDIYFCVFHWFGGLKQQQILSNRQYKCSTAAAANIIIFTSIRWIVQDGGFRTYWQV